MENKMKDLNIKTFWKNLKPDTRLFLKILGCVSYTFLTFILACSVDSSAHIIGTFMLTVGGILGISFFIFWSIKAFRGIN